jgi:hypothetical protein
MCLNDTCGWCVSERFNGYSSTLIYTTVRAHNSNTTSSNATLLFSTELLYRILFPYLRGCVGDLDRGVATGFLERSASSANSTHLFESKGLELAFASNG